MAVVFTYSGTVITFGRDPDVGDYLIQRNYMNPRAESAGGVTYVYDKNLCKDFRSLTWARMKAEDLTALLAFLDLVDGSANAFTYTDPEGSNATARIWNSEEIRSSPVWYQTHALTIVLLIDV